jgi:hypothetical protein
MARPVLQEMGRESSALAIRHPCRASKAVSTQSANISLGPFDVSQAWWTGVRAETQAGREASDRPCHAMPNVKAECEEKDAVGDRDEDQIGTAASFTDQVAAPRLSGETFGFARNVPTLTGRIKN